MEFTSMGAEDFFFQFCDIEILDFFFKKFREFSQIHGRKNTKNSKTSQFFCQKMTQFVKKRTVVKNPKPELEVL
jgi:hypothetical protein